MNADPIGDKELALLLRRAAEVLEGKELGTGEVGELVNDLYDAATLINIRRGIVEE